MADKKISALTAASTPLAGTEVLPIVQSGSTKKVATDDLTVKNVRSNTTTGILQIAGPAAAATRTMTVPDANFTVARTDAAQTFTGEQTLATGNLTVGASPGTWDSAFRVVQTTGGSFSTLTNDQYVLVNAYYKSGTGFYSIANKPATLVSFDNTTTGNITTQTAPAAGVDAALTLTTRTVLNAATGDYTLSTGNLGVGTSGKGIVDTNGNESLLFTATASAVNEITVANAATGNSPTLSATGDDTNIGVRIAPKGSGAVSVPTGNLTLFAGTFLNDSTAGTNTVDVQGNQVTIANGGTVDFPSFSGLLVINNFNVGAVTMYLVGGGGVTQVDTVATPQGTVTFNAGISGYTFTNTSGAPYVFTFFAVRTRPNA
jgi:hypothetical protein